MQKMTQNGFNMDQGIGMKYEQQNISWKQEHVHFVYISATENNYVFDELDKLDK